MSSTSPSPKDEGGAFFDDDNNKAMFLVLPAMILIYGSCCLIYCIHKCRRYCVVQKKKKLKEERKWMNLKNGQGFHNKALIIHDEVMPNLGPGIRGPRHPINELILEPMESQESVAVAKVKAPRKRQETDVDSLADVLKTEKLEAVAPGYSGNLSQEMQHLDNQLKVAFRLVDSGAGKETDPTHNSKVTSQPSDEAVATYAAWKALQRAKLPKLTIKTTPAGDTVVERIPQEKRLVMMQRAVDMREEDLRAIANVRQTLAKDMPRSMPDIFKRPDENATTLKKISNISKRRIFLSHQ